MTTRRRLIGGLTALGLLPASALAQDRSQPRFTCYRSQKVGRNKFNWRVGGYGKEINTLSGTYKLAITPADIQFMNGLKPASKEGGHGHFELEMKRIIQVDGPLWPLDMTFTVEGLQYDQTFPEDNARDFQLTFYSLAGQALKDFPFPVPRKWKPSASSKARLESMNQTLGRPAGTTLAGNIFASLQTHQDKKGFKYSSPDALAEMMVVYKAIKDADGKIKIAVNDPAKGLGLNNAILICTVPELPLDDLSDLINAGVDIEVQKYRAGECPPHEGCFLTTAASHALGLPDDCWELDTLRAFRDGPLQNLPGGPELVARYYTDAPSIVTNLPLHMHRRLWSRAWLFGVLPAAMLCKFGAHRTALSVYRRLFARLYKTASAQT